MRRSLCALALVLVVAVAAFAARQDFQRFSVDVPEGWSARDMGNGTVAILADDRSAAVSVTVNSLGTSTLEETAQSMAKALGGTDPTVDEDGDGRFTFWNGGVETQAYLTGGEDEYMMLAVTGQSDALAGILGTIELH